MKKFLGLGSILMLVAIMAIGTISSGAYWKVSPSGNNTDITMAKLDVTVASAPVSVTGAQPGVALDPQTITIKNETGSVDAKFRLSSSFVGDNGDLYNRLWVTVTDAGSQIVYDGWLKDLNNLVSTLSANGTVTYTYVITPDKTITNTEFFNAKTTFAFGALATQLANPGW